mgnify:CR=1 FL=1
MKKFLNNIKQEASHIRMSTAEKVAMQRAIFGALSPVPTTPSPYFFFSYQFRMVFAGVMLFLVAGTASAASGALPGDLLYPVKINVNEPLKVALAPSPAAKAAVHAELADARIEEAQALAAEGRLDGVVTEQLAANFDAHAQSAEDLATAVEPEDPAAAAQVKTKLASSLAVNGAVLRQIGKESADEDTKRESDSLGTRVIARAEGPARVAMSARAFAAPAPAAKFAPETPPSADPANSLQTMSFSASGDAETQAAAEDRGAQKVAARLQQKGADALAAAKKLFAAGKAELDASSTLQIEKELSAADLHMSVGSEALGAARFEEAQSEFTEVLRISARLSALLVAQKKFDGGLLKALLSDDSRDESGGGDASTEPAATSSVETNLYR